MPGEDDFCKWMDVVQNGKEECPPMKGKAILSSTILLVGGWTPEVGRPVCFQIECENGFSCFPQANYTIDVRVTSDLGPVFHICAAFEMKPKYGDVVELW